MRGPIPVPGFYNFDDKKVEAWAEQLLPVVAQLESRIAELESLVQQLRVQIAELEP